KYTLAVVVRLVVPRRFSRDCVWHPQESLLLQSQIANAFLNILQTCCPPFWQLIDFGIFFYLTFK
ncbi:hypothetical protein L9F63_022617, partial [Diploptera punctata]